jgi:hypothetical protein
MAKLKQTKDDPGFRQVYKQTGKESYGGGPGENLDPGPAGSHRDNNWKIGAAQCKTAKSDKVGPGKNLNEIGGGNFY